jgi:hypothetical protein
MSRRPIRRIAAIAAAVALSGLAGTRSDATVTQQSKAAPDAVAFVPITGSTGSVFRGTRKVSFSRFGTDWAFPGRFSSASGGDVFLYNPGSAPDGILHVSPSGTSATTSFRSVNVSGTYRPVVGDYDGNGYSDILWYAAGTPGDSLWLFKADGTYTTLRVNISGTYRPVVVDADGDGGDDIIWYGPGAIGDAMWLFGANGTYTSKSLKIGGDYVAVVGNWGAQVFGGSNEKVIWYSETGTDWYWRFDSTGKQTSYPLPDIGAGYTPLVGRFLEESDQDVYWYKPGLGAEQLWAFGPTIEPDVAVQTGVPQVKGTYVPVTADLDNDGFTDIVWSASGGASIWKWKFDGPQVSSVSGLPADGMPVPVDVF